MILQTTSRFVYSVQTYMLMFLKWNTSFGDTTGRTKTSTNFTTLSQNKRRKTGTQVFLTQQAEPKHQPILLLLVKTREGKLEHRFSWHNKQNQNIKNFLTLSQNKKRKIGAQLFLAQQAGPKHQQTLVLSVKTRDGNFKKILYKLCRCTRSLWNVNKKSTTVYIESSSAPKFSMLLE